MLATLSGCFGGLALLLATVGLYGVMSYNVARRRSEIGIRMALGAQQGRVVRMVLGEVAFLIGIGLMAGLAVALALTRFITSFLYGLMPNDPLIFTFAAALLAAVAAFAGYLPARRGFTPGSYGGSEGRVRARGGEGRLQVLAGPGDHAGQQEAAGGIQQKAENAGPIGLERAIRREK